MVLAWFFTGNIATAMSIGGLIIHQTDPVFLHERI
jgi:hypothetical protein